MASIKPEHLLDSHDYYSFLKNRKKTSRARESEESKNWNMYELLSRKAWTTVLLQIMKVRLLSTTGLSNLFKITSLRRN